MPPKAAGSSSSSAGGPSKKTETKKKERVIEDKTFGLKNKKGAKQQKFIQQVQKQVHAGGIHAKKIDPAKDAAKKPEEDVLSTLIFKPVQKVDKGADPKSILCAFFKQGTCQKGDKCKFSHDLTIERKSEKRSLYVDAEGGAAAAADTMDTWDDDKLKEVVEKKHAEANERMPNKTDIICKHFLSAVESAKYGWFWECPSGATCHYRHALPPGFVLKRDKKAAKDAEGEGPSLEDWIESERHKLDSSKSTKVTLETFVAWKKRKIAERRNNKIMDDAKKLRDFKEGNRVGLSGREMFTFNPEMMNDDDDDEDGGGTYNHGDHRGSDGEQDDEEVDETEYKEVALDDYESLYLAIEECKVEDEDLFNEDELD